MDEVFMVDTDGWFICGCGYATLDKVCREPHISRHIKGWCVNGIKLDPETKFKCICGKKFNNIEDSKTHAIRTICANRAIEYELYTCKTCDVECRNQSRLNRHNKTKHHLKLTQNIKKDEIRCDTCVVVLGSKKLYETHIKTKKHIRLSTEAPLSLTCGVCNITLNSQKQMKTHLATRKHKKNENLKHNTVSMTQDGDE